MPPDPSASHLGQSKQTNQHGWVPATGEPAEGEGPWCNPDHPEGYRWWCVADSAADAMQVFVSHDADPGYYGVQLILERVCIRRMPWDDQDEEHEIEECRYSSDGGAVEAWRLRVIES